MVGEELCYRINFSCWVTRFLTFRLGFAPAFGLGYVSGFTVAPTAGDVPDQRLRAFDYAVRVT